MWLATIHSKKVAEEIRPKLELYQAEVRDVLEAHFLGKPAKPVHGTDMIRAMCDELDRANPRLEQRNLASSMCQACF
jgi:hypothetical protein